MQGGMNRDYEIWGILTWINQGGKKERREGRAGKEKRDKKVSIRKGRENTNKRRGEKKKRECQE